MGDGIRRDGCRKEGFPPTREGREGVARHDGRGQGKLPLLRHGLNAAAKSLIYYVIQYDTE